MSGNAPVESEQGEIGHGIPTEPMRLDISRQVLERTSTSGEGEIRVTGVLEGDKVEEGGRGSWREKGWTT